VMYYPEAFMSSVVFLLCGWRASLPHCNCGGLTPVGRIVLGLVWLIGPRALAPSWRRVCRDGQAEELKDLCRVRVLRVNCSVTFVKSI